MRMNSRVFPLIFAGTLTPLSIDGLATATMLNLFFIDRNGSCENRLSQAFCAS